MESGFPSIVSTICSCGSDKMQPDGASSPSWIAAGMSSGQCRLFDARSGNVIASWRAHEGYVTKVFRKCKRKASLSFKFNSNLPFTCVVGCTRRSFACVELS